VQFKWQRLPNIPEYTALRNLLSKLVKEVDGDGNALNWGNPSHVYKILFKIIDASGYTYLDPIVSGLVISVGGLSERVVKESSKALVQWCKTNVENQSRRSLGLLMRCFQNLFAAHRKDDRVILPLIQTVELLLANSMFDPEGSYKNIPYRYRPRSFSWGFACSLPLSLSLSLSLVHPPPPPPPSSFQ
jgi:hypothetical protein